MKILASLILVILTVTNLRAQFLKKIKQKAETAVNKQIDKLDENIQKDKEKAGSSETNNSGDTKTNSSTSNLKV